MASRIQDLFHYFYVLCTILLRHVQLHILTYLTAWKRPTEQAKVAIYRSHRVASLHIVPHLMPLTAALALIILNACGFFVGNISTTALTGFQFAAKVLEIMIQASISILLLGLVRQQLVGAGSLPLGGLMAPLRLTDISYLWSLELWGFWTSRHLRGWRTYILAGLVPAFVILAALVGPSSAVLMIPRPVNDSMMEYLVIMDSQNALFPQKVDFL